jgi:hypothetical protein
MNLMVQHNFQDSFMAPRGVISDDHSLQIQDCSQLFHDGLGAYGVVRSPLLQFEVLVQIGTTKGTGGDVLILEEAAYCDEGFFYETVAPILSIGSASLVAISTLTSEINFYTRLIQMVDPSGHSSARSLPSGASSCAVTGARRRASRRSACTCCTWCRCGRARSGTASSRS